MPDAGLSRAPRADAVDAPARAGETLCYATFWLLSSTTRLTSIYSPSAPLIR